MPPLRTVLKPIAAAVGLLAYLAADGLLPPELELAGKICAALATLGGVYQVPYLVKPDADTDAFPLYPGSAGD